MPVIDLNDYVAVVKQRIYPALGVIDCLNTDHTEYVAATTRQYIMPPGFTWGKAYTIFDIEPDGTFLLLDDSGRIMPLPRDDVMLMLLERITIL